MTLYTGLASPIMWDTAAHLAADLSGALVTPNTLAHVQSIGPTVAVPGLYRFVAGSVTPDNNQSQLCIVPTTSGASGKWLRCDPIFDLILPVTFATADTTILVLTPAEMTLLLPYGGAFWEMTSAWAGGIDPRIGLSYDSPENPGGTAGSVLGGAAGDGPVSGNYFPAIAFYRGTTGTQFNSGPRQIVLPPAAKIRFNSFNTPDNFTSGAGRAHVQCMPIFTTIVPANPVPP